MFAKTTHNQWLLLVAGLCTSLAATAQTQNIPLEEIIVTAEKRETNLQKTPVTVNVVSGAQLEEASVTQVEDLQSVIPGISIFANANSTGAGAGSGSRNDITIRGVSGQTGGDPSTQPSAAIIIDGLYSQAGLAGSGAMFDIAQLEVLKGPQGTLYGRNATTGVINVTTQKPKFGNSGHANVDIGNFGKTNAGGAINFAIGDSIAIRAAAQSSKRNGYYRDGLSNEDTFGGRLKVLLQASEDVSLLFTATYAKDRSDQNGSTVISAATGDPVGDVWAANVPSGNDAVNFYSLYFQGPPRRNQNYSFAPQLDWKLGSATLTVIGGYARALTNEVGPTYIGTNNDSKERSLEARIASNDAAARLQWLFGLYYYDQNITGEGVRICSLRANVTGPVTGGGNLSDYNLSLAGPSLNSSSPCGNTAAFPTTTAMVATGRNNDQLNYSFFTQETFRIVDRVRITGGARWQHEKATRGAVTDVYYSGATPIASVLSGRAHGEKDWNAVTWRLGADMDVAPNSMLYAMVATGWKAGTPLQYLPPYDEQKPEKLTSYTLGVKNRFLDERLQVNAEVFYWNFRDRQINQVIACSGGVQDQVFENRNGVATPVACIGALNPPNGGVFVQGSAKKSHVQGVSLDLMYRPWVSDTFGAVIEYLDEAVHDDMGGQRVNGCSAECAAAFAPEWSATLSWRHVFEFGESGRYTLDARSKYESEKFMQIAADRLSVAAGREALTQDSYHSSGAGLSYAPEQGAWNVRAYIDNIEDEQVKTSAAVPATISTGVYAPTTTATFLAPRTYGLQLRVDF